MKLNVIDDDDLTALVNLRQRLLSAAPLGRSARTALADLLGDVIDRIASADLDLNAFGEK